MIAKAEPERCDSAAGGSPARTRFGSGQVKPGQVTFDSLLVPGSIAGMRRECAPKDHLDPSDDGETLSDDAVRLDDPVPEYGPFEDVQLEEDAHGSLENKIPPEVRCKVGVSGHVEPAAGVVVSEKVSGEREDDAEGLQRDMEPGPRDAEDHTDGEEDAPAKDLYPETA